MGTKPLNPLHLGVEAAENRLAREFQKAQDARAIGRYASAIGCLKTAVEIAQALVEHYRLQCDSTTDEARITNRMKRVEFETKCDDALVLIRALRIELEEREKNQAKMNFESAVEYMEKNQINYPQVLGIEHLDQIRSFLVESILIRKGFTLWPENVQASRREPTPKIAEILRTLPAKISNGERILEAEITGIFRCCHLADNFTVSWAVKLRIRTPWGVEKSFGILLPQI